MWLRYGNVLDNLDHVKRIFPEIDDTKNEAHVVIVDAKGKETLLPCDDFGEAVQIVNKVATDLNAGKLLCVML